MITRADKLLVELQQAYDACLKTQSVSEEALNITHEVIAKCSDALDQIMHTTWESRIAHKLQKLPKRGGYFPAASDEQSYRSTLGQWNMTNLEEIDPEFDRILRSYQPMTNEKNKWISQLRDLANKKHTGLVPQKRYEEVRTRVERGGGAISWSSGVRFSGGMRVLGVPIDPRTQLPIPMADTKVTREIWVSFYLEGTQINALPFCQYAVSATKKIIDNFAEELSLS
jgi:hypothetical protein